MSERLVKSVLITLILAFAFSYIYYFNPQPMEVVFSRSVSYEAPRALIVLFSFLTGAFVVSVFVFFIGLRNRFREWSFKRREELAKSEQALIVTAREQAALGDFASARKSLSRIISKDSDNIVARIQLAQTYRNEGDLPQALKVLENARVEQKKNIELLLLAADINAEMGNATAAFDNAALVLKLAPKNTFALTRLVRDSQSLKRFDQAVEYQRLLTKVSDASEQNKNQKMLASLELEAATKEFKGNPDEFKKSINQINTRHRDFAEGLDALARIEREQLNLDAASKLWSKAFSITKNTSYLEQLADTWLEAEEPGKAIANIKQALWPKGHEEAVSIEGQIFYTSLLLHLEMIEEGREEYSRLDTVPIKNDSLLKAKAALYAKLLEKEGKLEQAFTTLFETVASPILIKKRKSLRLLKDKDSASGISGWASKLKQGKKARKPASVSHLSIP